MNNDNRYFLIRGFRGTTLTAWALIILHLILLFLSSCFAYNTPALEKPIILFVGLQITIGLLYLFIVVRLKKSETTRALVIGLFCLGLAMRLILIPSTPILEDDAYRYLWDGAVLGSGSTRIDTPRKCCRIRA